MQADHTVRPTLSDAVLTDQDSEGMSYLMQREPRDNDDIDLPAPKPTLLSSPMSRSSLEAMLLTSSSESMGFSELSVCGVAGSAASSAAMSLCLVLLAFRMGCES